MGALSLRLPESLHEQLKELAREEGVSINQFVLLAVAEKVASLATIEYLEKRAQRGNREKLLKVLNRLALEIGVAPRRINEIVLGKRSITADTALRLGRFFGVTAQFWMGLQSDYDLDVAADHLGERLRREVWPLAIAERDDADYKI